MSYISICKSELIIFFNRHLVLTLFKDLSYLYINVSFHVFMFTHHSKTSNSYDID